MVWDENGIQVPFGEKIIGFRLKERGQISSCVPLWEQRNSFEDNEIPDAALSRPCAGLSGPKIAGVTGNPYAEESFRTIEHESAAPRSFFDDGSSRFFICLPVPPERRRRCHQAPIQVRFSGARPPNTLIDACHPPV